MMKFSDNMKVDSHVHVLPPERLAGLMRWIIRANPAHPVPADIDAAGILRDLRSVGTTHFFNFAYPLKLEETGPLNDFNLNFCANTPGAIPFGSMHVEDEDKPTIAEKLFDRGCVGLKFHPFVQRFDPWDERMDPLYDHLEEVGRPVLLHTGFEAFYRKPMPARELARLLERHPRLHAVFVHMMFPDIELAFRLLDDHPGLTLDATNCFACFLPMFREMLESSGGEKKLRDIFQKGICENKGRVLFGTDHPAGMGSIEDIYGDMMAFGLPEDAVNAILREAPVSFMEKYAPEYSFLSEHL